MPDFPEHENSIAIRIREVTASLARGDRSTAAAFLEPLVGITCRSDPIVPAPVLSRSGWPAGSGAKTRNPPPLVIARVYHRDNFTCRYCGRWTVPTQILRLVSAAFPDEFPYHPNWRMDITPRVYWDISTSIDHIHAVSTGGSWQDPANLATACARCQYQKSNLPLEILGWQLRPAQVDHSDWDGLVGCYETLWDAVGRPDERAHLAWTRAFATARQ
jgi:5-methylcytosine-specific restriction endonuclease McrA